MHRIRAAIVLGGSTAYRLVANKAGNPGSRQAQDGDEPRLDPALVARAKRNRLSPQELAAALHTLREESMPEDETLAHWVKAEASGEQPLLGKLPRPAADGEEEEPSLIGEIVPRRVSRTADTRREDRIVCAVDGAVLTFRGDEHSVRVVNTSSRGLQIETDLKAHIAEELAIRLDDGPTRPCYVRWVRGGRIGLGFREKDLLD